MCGSVTHVRSLCRSLSRDVAVLGKEWSKLLGGLSGEAHGPQVSSLEIVREIAWTQKCPVPAHSVRDSHWCHSGSAMSGIVSAEWQVCIVSTITEVRLGCQA